jgi:hypothetical protein
MSTNTKHLFNVKFTVGLLIRIALAFDSKKVELGQSEVSRYGVYDDFLYSEYLTDNFDDLLQDERLAVMQIIRSVIHSSAQCYFKLLEEGEYQYEDFGIYNDDNCELEDCIEQLSSTLKTEH